MFGIFEVEAKIRCNGL